MSVNCDKETLVKVNKILLLNKFKNQNCIYQLCYEYMSNYFQIINDIPELDVQVIGTPFFTNYDLFGLIDQYLTYNEFLKLELISKYMRIQPYNVDTSPFLKL